MRFVTWNCRIGAFRGKAQRIAPLRSDVHVAQEVESIENVLLFGGEYQPTYRDRMSDPAYPRRAVGVFSYTDTALKSVDSFEPLYGFRRYEGRRGDLLFQAVGVWTAATDTRETSYMQAHEGIRRHGDWIRRHPTVILGDFNDNASYRTPHWQRLLDLMRPLGLESAYHRYFAEAFGAETRPTHFHGGRETAPFHLDYCFVPKAWADRLTRVEVGKYEDWHAHSDHVPLIVDIDV